MIGDYNIVFISKIMVNVSIGFGLKEIREGWWTVIALKSITGSYSNYAVSRHITYRRSQSCITVPLIEQRWFKLWKTTNSFLHNRKDSNWKINSRIRAIYFFISYKSIFDKSHISETKEAKRVLVNPIYQLSYAPYVHIIHTKSIFEGLS
jgi:hypothetical protein